MSGRNSEQNVIFGNPTFPSKGRNLNFDSFVCVCLFDIIHVICAFLFFSSVIDPIVEQRQSAGGRDDVGMIVLDNVLVKMTCRKLSSALPGLTSFSPSSLLSATTSTKAL